MPDFMPKILVLLAILLVSNVALAQESEEQASDGAVADEQIVETAQGAASDEGASSEDRSSDGDTSSADGAESTDNVAEGVREIAGPVGEMVQYLGELTHEIEAANGNCEAMVSVLSGWHASHSAWINGLDYATVNANAQTVEQLRVMAQDLGKKLSVCYDSPQIPALLMKYSGF